MLARRPLILMTLSFALGILIAAVATPLIGCVGVALLLSLALYCYGSRSHWLAIAVLCGVALLGVARYRNARLLPANDISRIAPAVVTVVGTVRTTVESPHVTPSVTSPQFSSCLFAVREAEVDDGVTHRRLAVTGGVLLRLPVAAWSGQDRNDLDRVYGMLPRVGEVLRVRGRLDLPSQQRNPGGFDERAWLARRGITAVLTIHGGAEWQSLGRQYPFDIPLSRLRQVIVEHWRQALTAEQGGVMEALSIGARIDVPHHVTDDFERTGTIHLLATAGLHVGVLAALLHLLWDFVRVPRRAGLLLTIGVEVLYAAMTGGRPSVIRAVSVVTIVLFGLFLEREPDLPNALSLAAFGLLLVDPSNLSDPGFQLTFATVITILLLMPHAQDLLRRMGSGRNDGLPEPQAVRLSRRSRQWVTASLFLTITAQIGCAPLVAYYFNTISPVAPLANLLVVPVTPLTLACGFVAPVAGLVFAPLALPFDMCARWLVAYQMGAAHRCADLPYAYLSTISPPVWLVVAYYGVVWSVAWGIRRRSAAYPLVLFFGIHLILLGWSALANGHDHGLRVTFLDVGQGDAAVIETPGGRTIVVDTGGQGAIADDDEGWRVVGPFLAYRGINQIDALILTHPHADHIGGAATLMKRFHVDKLIDNGQDAGDREVLTQALTAAHARGVPRNTANPGRVLDCGDGVTIEELAPNAAEISGQPNNASVVLRLTYGRTIFLFTGDAEMDEEGDLLHRGNRLDCDVLKVGHHGSRTSTTPAFLTATHPHWAIISVGKHNLYGHPNADVISRLQASGATVYRTDQNGAVTFRSDGFTVTPLPLHIQ